MEMLRDCEGIIVGVDPLDADVIASAPKCWRFPNMASASTISILPLQKNAELKVSRTIGANSDAVADYAFTLMLGLARKVLPIDAACRRGDWKKITTLDLNHKTIGIFGLGANRKTGR